VPAGDGRSVRNLHGQPPAGGRGTGYKEETELPSSVPTSEFCEKAFADRRMLNTMWALRKRDLKVPPFAFFTSYARPDANRVSKLDKVVEELLERVRAKLGLALKPQEVGFFDRTNIETGKKWEEVLGNDLRTARVIVCLCSPTYFNSAFCAKEFEVFRRRLENADKKVQGLPIVVPVIWEPGSQRVEAWRPRLFPGSSLATTGCPQHTPSSG